jgi:hypothetical protein
MKRSKFTDEQILAIVKEGEAGRKVADSVARMGSPSRRTTAGKRSTAGWSSVRCSG